jgi:hypothetical protein
VGRAVSERLFVLVHNPTPTIDGTHSFMGSAPFEIRRGRHGLRQSERGRPAARGGDQS